jgi:uncharacterized repeat protein (TIGR01451 family)
LDQTVVPATVSNGGNVTFTLTVTNHATTIARGVVLTNQLPVGLEFVSASVSQGSWTQSNGTVLFSLGEVPNRSPAQVTIVARASASGSVTNQARVASAALDSSWENNSSLFVVNISANADLAVTAHVATDPVIIGESLTLSVTVTNRGPGIAGSVVMTNIIPPNVTFLSATASQGTAQRMGDSVVSSLGEIVANAAAVVSIVMTPTATGVHTNQALVAAAAPDSAPGDNVVTTLVSVLDPPQLAAALTGNQLTFSWPATLRSFVLESTGSLNPGVNWMAVTNQGTVAGDRVVVAVDVDVGQRYFRLKR